MIYKTTGTITAAATHAPITTARRHLSQEGKRRTRRQLFVLTNKII
jgi:hypothetical protein